MMEFQKTVISKGEFLLTYRNAVENWADTHRRDLLDFEAYRWNGLTYSDSRRLRDKNETDISKSKEDNGGGINLETINRIYYWGFGQPSPFTSNADAISVTKVAFEFLTKDDSYNACKTLMLVKGVGVAGSTKILGLSDQRRCCIYESRVGLAMHDLAIDGQKLVLCPPGRNIPGDVVPSYLSDHVWSWNYHKLIWVLQIALRRLSDARTGLRISDLEMSLFMKGDRLRKQGILPC
jgi:hypothetical protein